MPGGMTVQKWYEEAYEYTKIQGIAFNREDPAAWDWDEGDLTTDGNWHDLDLSAIVPKHAKFALIGFSLQDNLIGQIMRLRRNGNVNTIAAIRTFTQVANIRVGGCIPVPVDTDRKIEYSFTATLWTNIGLAVIGWIF